MKRALAEGKDSLWRNRGEGCILCIEYDEKSIRSETANDRLYVLYKSNSLTRFQTSLVWYCVSSLRMANTVQQRLLALNFR
jgi:hypothetical protein